MTYFDDKMHSCGRSRENVVSKALSVQKYQSNLYTAPADSGKDDVSRDGDPLLELLCWLSNVVRIYNHVTSAPFRSRLAAPQSQPPGDVTESVQELCDSLEEMISFMFQQTVYSITKVLFAPVGQILQPAPSPCADHSRALAGMERVLHVLKATLDVGEDVSLHRDVILQLLTYLIFFVTTTLFNKLMAKGSGAKLFCWSVGVRLQACVSHLEEWVGSVGLDAHYLRVSERLLSLVDLLATSRHTLLRMDWPSFRRQYSPLSESQLLKVLTEYQFTEGQGPPASWLPPPGVSPTDDVSISLSAHPAFTLPRQGPGMDLSDTFPPPLHDQLQQLTNIFSTDADLSSRGERSSSDASTGRHGQQTDVTLTSSRATGPLGTFFTSESSPNVNDLRDNRPPALLPPHKMNGDGAEFPASPPLPQRHRGGSSPPPPKLPPRSATIHFADPPVQPPAPTPAPRGILSPRNTGRGVANVSARNPPLGGTSGGSSEGSRNNHPGHNSSGGSLSARNPPSGGLFEGSRNPNPGHSAGGSLSARGNPASSSAGGGSGVNGKAGILSNPRTVADAHRSGGGSLSARTHAAAHNHNNNNSSFPDYATVAPSSARSALRGGSSSSKPQNHTDGVGGGDPTAKHVDFATAHDTRLTHSARGAPLYSVPANNTHSTHNNNNTNSGGNSGGGGGGSQGKVKAALQNHARSHPSGGAPPYGHAHSGHAPSGHAPSGHSSADHNHYHQQIQPILKREPPPYHKVSNLSAPEKRGGGGFQQHHHQHQDHQHHAHNSPQDPQSPGFQSQDPRRRPLNGMTLSNGPLTLQDKRIINNVPPLEIPSEDLSNASDSAVSDDVFVQSHSSSADEPMLTAGSSFHSSSDFRRFSAGRLSQDRSEKEGEEERGEGDSGAEVIRVDMRQEPGSDNVTLDTYPDDIYIDVMTTEVEPGGSARQLKVLPLEEGPLTNGYDSDPNDPSQSDDAPRVRYRHKMPQERDSSTKGEITGEVFTLTLLKEGERLGMGLIDGMYTPLKLPGIYVRNVLPGTPAALCGHIRVGDRILAINGRSIVGADYNSAMGLIRSTGPTLNMLIAKCDRSVTARISAS